MTLRFSGSLFPRDPLTHSCSPTQEFDSCERAREFLESSRPRDFEAVGSAVELAFARPAEPARSEPARSEPERDWSCPACPATNFVRRRACFQCGEPRPSAPEDALPRPDREPHVASVRQPRSHTVLLTNLDASIAEESWSRSARRLGRVRGWVWCRHASFDHLILGSCLHLYQPNQPTLLASLRRCS